MIKKVDLKKERYLMFIDTETIGTLNVKESVLPFEIGMKIFDLESKKVVKEKRLEHKSTLGHSSTPNIVGPGTYSFLPEVYPWVKQSYNSKFI